MEADSVTEQAEQPQTLALFKPLSFAYARRNGVLVVSDESGLTVHHKPGISPLVLAELERRYGLELHFEEHAVDSFEQLLNRFYEGGSGKQIDNLELAGDLDLLSVAEQLGEPEDLLDSEDDAPIIRLINAILTEAIKNSASDIHIEPYENRLSVRLRIDGVLQEVVTPPKELASLLVSRIKVMAKLDIAEKRLPQDGRISLKLAGRAIDVRVSTLPTGGGERVVLRLLDNQAGRLDLSHLGMSPTDMAAMSEVIKRPHGIILVTGPTGSGKTTTLYAALNQLNSTQRNIITVEDPIEYYLDGVGQTQVNTKVDMTFARGLRAILRQDPDVVMVGEIRDLETAEIAVQASLTGHLVLSTLHTNTAIGAITRLRDMGIEPFLLSSSLVAVLAQRLVRRLCEHCKEPYTPDAIECQRLGIAPESEQPFYRAVGCPHCHQQGYRGRTGIYELVTLDGELSKLIHDGASEQILEKHVRQYSDSILHDGVSKIRQGVTSVEEVLRVTRDAQLPDTEVSKS